MFLIRDLKDMCVVHINCKPVQRSEKSELKEGAKPRRGERRSKEVREFELENKIVEGS